MTDLLLAYVRVAAPMFVISIVSGLSTLAIVLVGTGFYDGKDRAK